MGNRTDDLLRVLIRVTARVTIPPADLRQIVAPDARSEKQLQAYNRCDGTKTQAEIVKELKLDSSNFSKTVRRWEKEGVLFRIGDDEHLLHLYPLF